MLLWLLLALLTALVAAALSVPLLRPRVAAKASRGAFDRAVYRDQLAEVERDLARGLLEPAEAEAARLEIQRRLLATATPEPIAEDAPRRGAAFLVIGLLVAGAIGTYAELGHPDFPDLPFAARRGEIAANTRAEQDLAASVDRLALVTQRNPQDREGWLRLASGQAAMQRWQDSAESYRRAIALADTPEAEAGYGEMMSLAAEGVVTPAARAAFDTALKQDGANVAARFYLALAEAQSGHPREAMESWRKQVAEAPANAPWVPAIRQQMAATAKQAGLPLPAEASTPPAGPNAEDVAAAGAMSDSDRQAMIRGMVERLAARLEQSPEDAAGWLRLAQSYAVLGENEKSAAAASRAAALRPQDPDPLLAEARARLAASGVKDDFRRPLPPELVAVLQKLLALDPKQPDALWYLGLAEAQHHHGSEAAEYWRRLLPLLDPQSQTGKTVAAALQALTAPQ